MAESVRVRFAPSPTGLLHVGGVRSALFNYLWARHTKGSFVLRVEDTDRARLVEGAEEQIIASLQALGARPDEGPGLGGDYGPYRQSERLATYREHADRLVATGALYPCWCSSERLDALRSQAQRDGTAFKYDRHCQASGNERSESEPHVLRFRIPGTGVEAPTSITWDDAVRGALRFETDELDDFIALKADGYPTYHFANVVDDHLMAITHVLRADEWIPSTPKHLLLFAAFGWTAPTYAHLPAVQGPTGGKKLSKRDGAQSVTEYVEEGYLPEALMSFLASLGWNDGTTQEIYRPEELIAAFSLERIQKSPARFDKDRLTWINGAMIRAMPLADLMKRCEAFWPLEAAASTGAYRMQVLSLVQERLKYLAELPELTTFFFVTPHLTAELWIKNLGPHVDRSLVTMTMDRLSGIEWTKTELEREIRDIAEEQGVKVGTYFGLLRICVTGQTAAPGLFETMWVIGQEECLERLSRATKLTVT